MKNFCNYSFLFIYQAMMKVISPSNCENEPYKLVCLNQVLDNFTPKIIFYLVTFLHCRRVP